MQNPFKGFFYFSRGERRGILVLITGILLVFLFGHFYSHRQEQPLSDEEARQQITSVSEYEAFIASVQEIERKTGFARSFSPKSAVIQPAVFNPNTADSAAFRRLGLPGWMARNIMAYRSKGGKFRKAEDFRRIYGLKEEQYRTLLPYIHIPPEDTVKDTPRIYTPSVNRDSLTPRENAVYKYPQGTLVDLNLADTTELKKIPGIGSGIARMITDYRRRLGGFHRIEQLQDIRLDYNLLQPWLHIDSRHIQRINLNRTGIEKLRSHPYINFYQAKAIVEYRKKKGELRSLKPFTLYEEFSEEDIEKIGHYVCFE